MPRSTSGSWRRKGNANNQLKGKMNKKVLIISSTPRKGGNSDILCDEFAAGAKGVSMGSGPIAENC